MTEKSMTSDLSLVFNTQRRAFALAVNHLIKVVCRHQDITTPGAFTILVGVTGVIFEKVGMGFAGTQMQIAALTDKKQGRLAAGNRR